MVRTCYRENIRDIKKAQLILNYLIKKYNYHLVHSTTGEIPYIRFQRAIREKRTLFREFAIMPPFLSTKDIFCLRVDRMVNSYRKISVNNAPAKQVALRASKRGKILAGYSLLFSLSLLDILHTS